jgi:hypothetical protein
LGYGSTKHYKHRNMGLVVDLGPRYAVANPLGMQRRDELRGVPHCAQFPGHLIQVIVVQYGNDQPGVGLLLPVFRHRGEFGRVVPLRRTVADEGDARAIRMAPLRPEG